MRVKRNPIVFMVILGFWVLISIVEFISINHGYFEYNWMKSNCQVLEGRIASINMESQRSYGGTVRRRTRYTTYLKALIVYTEDGEEKIEEFRFPLFKGEGDAVKLARLPDGSLVPLFIQLSGNVNAMIFLGTFLLLAVVILWRTKLYPKVAASSNTVQLVTDDFDSYTSQEERLMTMVNTSAQTVNTNEEVEISEESEAVIPVNLRGKEQDSFYSLEDPGGVRGNQSG